PLNRKQLGQAGYADMLRLIKEAEPPRPSTRLSESKESLASVAARRRTEPARLTRDVRGDLDWIVMKALEKDRTRRYETASGFAADVLHYLHDEPVQAFPPSAWYRFRKFARRNKVALTGGGFVAVALVVGLLTSTWQAIRAMKAEALAEERWEDAEENRNKAEGERDRARKAEREAGHRLYEAKLPQAKADRGNEKLGQRSQSLKALAEAAALLPTLKLDSGAVLDLRNEVIEKLTLTDLQLIRQW